MGVPKLFRYLAERYPCLSQTLSAYQLPQYDYFYIDSNNLIHKSLSDRNLLPLEKVDDEFLTESRIFERVLCYIETLHRIVPSRVLFLAIDGVAPRAKWNTQRERRLRVLEKDDASKQFDTNAISPGTIFMQNFEAALLEFISHKIKCDSSWQNCEVYVSGSSCPGEGSLKIIDYIRSLKQSKDYKSNATHCIYSGDNDLLLLGIATHELYVTLLQERKKGGSVLSTLCSDDTKHQFEVVHFELLRQYLRMEFIDCQNEMSFEFNMDNIVDDWVLLMTLIGNDYVPGLPNFNLELGALTTIYDSYKEVLKTSNGYINESGFLHVSRFARLIQALKPKDFDLYRKSVQNSIGSINVKLSKVNLNNNIVDPDSMNGSDPKVSDFLEMKDQFYTEKLGDSKMPDYEQMSVNYVKTMQWVLFYYFRGTCFWTHSYPDSFAPFVSDFTTVGKVTILLNVDHPVRPFTHLLAILPKSSSHLLPKSYQMMMFDDLQIDMESLLQNSYLAEKNLNADDKQRNKSRPMIKIQYAKSENPLNSVEVTEIIAEKKPDRPHIGRYVSRPFRKNDFNFKFSTLNLHDYSSKLVERSFLKPYPRIVITLNADQSADIDTAAKEFLNQTVYVNWPHFIEAKVIQLFDATKKYNGSSNEDNITLNPPEFSTCVDEINSRYSGLGIEAGEIKMVAYVSPLKWVEYKASETDPHAYELFKHWDADKWLVVAVQTLVKSFMPQNDPPIKLARHAFNVPNVFLFSKKSYHYGEMAAINDAGSLEINGRINILSNMKQEPDFDKAIEVHTAVKANQLNEFKQPATAATYLGIHERVLGKITGSVLVSPDDSTDAYKKINIGLQLKVRGTLSSLVLLPDYVKTNGKQFLYSQLAIDLVQQYMDKFPRIFELISAPDSSVITISDLKENNNNQPPLEYLAEIQKWQRSMPHYKATRTPLDVMRFSDDALKYVLDAVHATESTDSKVLRLKMKWQNLFIPDLNSVFAVPCPDASYKLLDRVVFVHSGYPIPIGAKGTVIGIEPLRNHLAGNDITENELYALEILMDFPYKIGGEFKHHRIYRTRSTNMLINISYGRTI